MLNYLIRIFLVIIIGLLIGSNDELSAQYRGKAKEKIRQVKRIKMMDMLNLDQAASEKFLSKYNDMERQLDLKRDALDKAYDDLDAALKRNAGAGEIIQKNNEVLRLQSEVQNMKVERLKAMKSYLNEVQYAKFLLFENRFSKELQAILIQQYDKMNSPGDMQRKHK